jgi:hypothetical protein
MNLKKHPVDALRKQLAEEGISDADFDEALKVALKTPLAAKVAPKKHLAGAVFLIGGVLLVLVFGLISLSKKAPAIDAPIAAPAESAFVGDCGYVVSLPENYMGSAATKGPGGRIELVHFAKNGTNPTHFFNEGLYGQMGIVRLEVKPHPLAGRFGGIDQLTAIVEAQALKNEEKFSKKPLEVSALHGAEFTFEVPFPRIETYILGEKHLYTFTAGQVDEIYRKLVFSLRETSGGS